MMMISFQKRVKNTQWKQRGDALVLSLFFSVFVLLIGVGLSRILIQDMFALRSAVFTEKAYYGAESGVEIALQEIKDEPIDSINVLDIPLAQSTVDLLVENSVEEESFIITPSKTERLRFAYDNDSSQGESIQSVSGLSIETDEGGLLCRFICKNSADLTVSIQGTEDVRIDPKKNFSSFDGTIDNSVGATIPGTVSSFLSGLGVAKTSCYLNLQNIGGDPIEVGLSSGSSFSPLKTHIVSTGKAGEKVKVISFDSQNSLGSFFDFGFLFQE